MLYSGLDSISPADYFGKGQNSNVIFEDETSNSLFIGPIFNSIRKNIAIFKIFIH